MYDKCLSRVQHFATLWTVASQAPLSMGFSRQEYWSGLPSSRHLPNPGIKSMSVMPPALAGRSRKSLCYAPEANTTL